MIKTVLLIDDDQDDLDILKAEIQSLDPLCKCLCLTSPQNAIRFLAIEKSFRPDFIFVDFNMPEMTGDVCVMELRKHTRLNRPVITALSTSMPEEKIAHMMSAGADHAFSKPITSVDFHKMLLIVFATGQSVSSIVKEKS